MRWIFAGLTAVVLVGCGQGATTSSSSQSNGPDTCNAAAYSELVGQDAVQALTLPDPKRSYRLDEPVTTDYVANRLNIKLDETDTIIAVTCG